MSEFLAPSFAIAKLAKSIALANLGSGIEIFAGLVGNSQALRTLLAGSNINLIITDDGEVEISADVPNITASNVGEVGVGVFKGKVLDNLEFKKLIAGTHITLVEGTDGITFNVAWPGIPNITGANAGSGQGIYKGKVSDILSFYSLTPGDNVTIELVGDEIVISSSGGGGGGGEVNTASNVGSGAGLYQTKVGVNLRFKSLLSSAGLAWDSGTDEVTLNLDATLIALAGITTAANTLIYATGADTFNTTGLSVFGRSLIDDADASAARNTLGLGNSVTRDVTTSASDTTSERLWRTNDLVKVVSNIDVTPGNMLTVGYAGLLSNSPPTEPTDLNNQTKPVFLRAGGNAANRPAYAGTGASGVLVLPGGTSARCTQLHSLDISATIPRLAVRNLSSSGWNPWAELWTSANQLNLGMTPAAARTTLELGSSALADLLSGPFETTPGAVLRWGDHGIGASNTTNVTDLDQLFPAGFRSVSGAAAGRPSDAGSSNGSAFFLPGGISTRQAGLFIADSFSVPRIYLRTFVSGTANPWLQLWHSGNLNPATADLTVTTRSGTSYTFSLSDNANSYNRFTNAGSSTCTVPPNSSVAFPIGHRIKIRRAAAATLTLTPGSGVILNAPSGGTLVMTNNMTVELIKVDTNTWDVVGQTVPI